MLPIGLFFQNTHQKALNCVRKVFVSFPCDYGISFKAALSKFKKATSRKSVVQAK